MPDSAAIRDEVLSDISKASGVPKGRLTDKMKLRDDLQISHQNYVALAQNLRAFVKENNPGGTLLLTDIDTAAATVGTVVQFVTDKVKASA